MANENTPKVDFTFLKDYSLSFTNFSSKNRLADTSVLNGEDSFAGKKGFHLCGGSVNEETKEISGCVLDGTFTFYESKYKGWLGAKLSNTDTGKFDTAESVVISTSSSGTYIKSLIIVFDEVSNEYATKIAFDNAIKADGTTDTTYTQDIEFENSENVFLFNFGETSTIVSVRLIIKEWSKKNAFVKITRIRTGYKKQYTSNEITSIKWDNFKVSDENELSFGVSSNTAEMVVLDNENILYKLYSKDLIYDNVETRIYLDDILQGVYYLSEKSNERGSQEWTLSCVDALEKNKNDICPTMQLTTDMTMKALIEWVCSDLGMEPVFTEDASVATTAFVIPKAYITKKQSYYSVLLKCCQVCCLRMYMAYGKLVITSGL
jgi:hypothetical protein